MQLESTNIHSIEQVILHSEIPYEDVKIELIDHLATEVEIRMDANPGLSFADALRLSATNLKESIIGIRRNIQRQTITKLVLNTFDFTNWLTWASVLFFGAFAYRIITLWGFYFPLGKAIFGIAIIGVIIAYFRMRKIDVRGNYVHLVLKNYAWVPMFLAAGTCFAISYFFLTIMIRMNFWFVLERVMILPAALSFGIFMKTVLDLAIFNIQKLKEYVEVDSLFLQPSSLKEQTA